MVKRETELDILRLLAALGVIFTHASGVEMSTAFGKALLTFLTATVTWHVPVFVMLSGRFFLDPRRSVSPGKLKKAILRLVIAFLFWNTLYQIYYILTGAYAGLSWKGIASQALVGGYHLWYLYMLVCLYAITPFLRKIVENKRLTEYFLLLFFLFSFLTTYGCDLPLVGDTLSQILTKMNFHFALGYSGYYVLGYYLRRYPLSGRKEAGLYALGIGMVLFTGLATVWNTSRGADGEEWFSKYLMPNVILEGTALYNLFVHRVSRISFGEKTAGLLARLSGYSFGTYLIHALVLELLTLTKLLRFIPCPSLSLMAAIALTYAISTALTAALRKIPILGKYIT